MSKDRNTIEGLDHDACEKFARQGYLVLPALIEPPLKDFLRSYVLEKFANGLLSTGDALLPSAPGAYADQTFDGLLEFLRPRIQTHVGAVLSPTYSYFRIYRHGDVLAKHRDRAACEISVSLNLGQDPADPWPLCIEGRTGVYGAMLLPGDGLIYRGTDHFHWRDRYEGNRLVQAFLHYVDSNGPHKDEKFDHRPSLMRPKGYSAPFGAGQPRPLATAGSPGSLP